MGVVLGSVPDLGRGQGRGTGSGTTFVRIPDTAVAC